MGQPANAEEGTLLGTPIVQPAQGGQTPPPFAPQFQPHGQASYPQGQVPYPQGQHAQPQFQQPYAQQGPGVPGGPGQGQPPFGPPGQQPYGQAPYPAAPPRAAGSTIATIGTVAVLVLGGIGAVGFKVLKKSAKRDRTSPSLTLPQASSTPITVPSTRVTPPPPTKSTKPRTTTRTVVPNVFTDRTLTTAYDDSFVRAGASSGTCKTQSPPAFAKVLAKHPCIGRFRAGVYVNTKKTAVITVVVMPLRSATHALAVKRAAAYPYLLNPGRGYGVPSIKGKRVSTWNKIFANGNLVIFAMAHRPDGKNRDPSGVVQRSAGHLGAEFTALLNW